MYRIHRYTPTYAYTALKLLSVWY